MAKDKTMDAHHYPISQLAADVKRVCAQFEDERQILSNLRPLARRAALSKASWIEPRMYSADAAQGFGVHLLHEEPDHTMAVLALSWLPNRGAPPHDHGTWAVVAGVDGPEKNEFFERADDRSRPGHAELKKIGEKVCGVGDVVALPKGTIHSVWNETDGVTLSLHIYGKHINFTGRSQFDLKTQTETPFIVKMQN
jgi:predicted metal-dependent enzyme (double-stranded beta helix superfamily)